MPAARNRSWRKRLAAASLSLALCLVVAELLVRAVAGAPLPERLPILTVRANPYRGWEMLPGEAHYTYDHRVAVNALGLRGPEVAPKPPGERRVLALGDSLVYGQGVADDETLPRLLERELNARPRSLVDQDGAAAAEPGPWTVVNAGHRAYDTRQELGLLEELGPAIDADVVVLFWYRNDFLERDVEGTHARLAASGPIAFDVGRPVEGVEAWKWRAKQLLRRSAALMFVHDALKRKHHGQIADETPAGLERLAGYLDGFLRLAEEQGFQPLFCTIPGPEQIPAGAADRSPDREARALAAARGIPTLDLYHALRALYEHAGELPVVPYDGHYAARSNAAMAAAVRALVLEHAPEPRAARADSDGGE